MSISVIGSCYVIVSKVQRPPTIKKLFHVFMIKHLLNKLSFLSLIKLDLFFPSPNSLFWPSFELPLHFHIRHLWTTEKVQHR